MAHLFQEKPRKQVSVLNILPPFFGVYVTFEGALHAVERYAHMSLDLSFLIQHSGVALVLYYVLAIISLAHWLHAVYEGRHLLVTICMAAFFMAALAIPLYYAYDIAAKAAHGDFKVPVAGTPYIDITSGDLKYYEPFPKIE